MFVTADDEVRLGDFGLCTRCVEDRTLTYVGTEYYMPPEAILGRNMNQGKAGDIWGLGCILYELLTSKFMTDYENSLGSSVIKEPAAINELLADIPPKAKSLKPILR